MELCVVLSVLFLLALGMNGGVSQIHDISCQIDPKVVIIGGDPTRRLHIQCLQREGRNIGAIEIGRLLPGHVQSKMATLRHGDKEPSIADETKRKRMRTSGSITELSGHLIVDVYQLTCQDAGEYYCMSTFKNNDRPLIVSDNVTQRATPHVPYMRVTPNGSPFHVGLDLRLKCSGRVGSDSARRLWRWEWRKPDKTSPWREYPYQTNITYEHPTPDPTSPCEFKSSSTLIHTVTKEDDGRLIRCFVIDSKYSDQVTIHVKSKSEGLPHNYTFIILACVVCGMCILPILSVLFIILYRSMRNNKASTQVVIVP